MYKEDGLPCMNDDATCAEGHCLTLEQHCKFFFGESMWQLFYSVVKNYFVIVNSGNQLLSQRG